MKSNILLFSTRDIKINGTIFEEIISSKIAKSLCDYFYRVNKKELSEEKEKHVSQQSEKTLPTTKEIKDIIKKGCGGQMPSDLTRLSNGLSSEDLTKRAIENFEQFLSNRKDEGRTKALEILKSYVNNKVLFNEDDFNNQEVLNNWKAVNISKKDKTIKDRISIFQTAKDECEINKKKQLIQVFAVWALSMPNKDKTDPKDSVSWVETLVQTIVEYINSQLQKDSINKDPINEVELFLLLHDKDLESTYNTPFKTIYTQSKVSPNYTLKYTLISFTHADNEYDQLKRRKANELRELLDDVKKYALKSNIFQTLIELSDLISLWPDKVNEFKNKLDKLKEVIGNNNWQSEEWRELRCGTEELLDNWSNKTERKAEKLLFVNTQINNKIKAYI